MQITKALLAEHVVFHNMFDHLERIIPALKTSEEVKALSSLVTAMMKDHSTIEDQLLIEPMEHCLSQLGQEENFHEEHDKIDDALVAIQDVCDADTGKELLLKAVHLAREHFDKEDRLVFPLAEQNLSEASLLELGRRWEKERDVIFG